MAAPVKEYGLFVRNAKKPSVQPKLAIFDDDSDDGGHSAVGKSLQREANRIQAKKQVKINLNSALAEDPTVFKYDEIYDDITQKKEEQTGWQKRNKEKTPKYIASLMKAAKTRKLEQERALERKVQKEREAEGQEFAQKEAFVTSGFKKKLKEMDELDEKNEQEARIEALTDVTKQNDLSGFYRHLYKHTLGADEKKVTEGSSPSLEMPKETKSSGDLSSAETSESISENILRKNKSPKQFRDRKQRHFRGRRRSTDSSSESEKEKEKKISHKQPRIKSRDSSSSSESTHATAGPSHKLLQERDKPEKSRPSKRNSGSSNEESPIRSKYSRSNDSVADRRVENNHKSKDKYSRRRSPSGSADDSDERHSKRRCSKQREHSPAKSRSKTRDERETHRRREESSRHHKEKRSQDFASQKRETHPKRENRHNSKTTETTEIGKTTETAESKKTTETTESGKTAEELRREKLVALFKKRNFGDVFEQARDRYLARKQARQVAFGQGS